MSSNDQQVEKLENLIVLGPSGCETSVVASRLVGDRDPLLGNETFDGPFRIKFKTSKDGRNIGDCIGFGETAVVGQTVDLKAYKIITDQPVKDILLKNSFKFVLCVKFDGEHCPNENFQLSCEQFCDVFGKEGVCSMVLVAIQSKNQRSLKNFTKILHETSGYKLLKNKNNDTDVPFVLWDNYLDLYPYQTDKLSEKLSDVKEFVFSQEIIKIIEAFEINKSFLDQPKAKTKSIFSVLIDSFFILKYF